MKKKIYYIQPTCQTSDGKLLRCDSLYVHSLAMQALRAATPAFFIPKLMTAEEAERGFLELYGKLAVYSQIIIRSVCFNPFMMSFLLGMNIVFRREYSEMKRKHKL